MASGVVWVVATLLGVVLGFADAAGLPIDDPTLWSQLTDYVWTLETLRVAIISALVAAAATTVAAMSLTRKGIATAAFLAVAALCSRSRWRVTRPATPTTRPRSTPSPPTWSARRCGSGACWRSSVLRPALGRHLPTVVRRYSGMALWCFVAVAVSGVVSAVIRLGGIGELGNLATAYGALSSSRPPAWSSSACSAGSSAAGWSAGWPPRVPGRGLFLRFAVTELVVMGVAVGFATALSRTPTPGLAAAVSTPRRRRRSPDIPEPAAPTATTWLTLWRYDWLWGVLAVLAVGVYVMWVIRLRRRGDHWSVLRLVWWVVGWVVLVWATCGAPGVLGRVSFSWHMVEHMTIAMYAPMFLVLAAPVSLALRARPRPRRTAASVRVSCSSGWCTRGCCGCSATRSSPRRCSSSASWCSTTRRCSGWPSRRIPGTC